MKTVLSFFGCCGYPDKKGISKKPLTKIHPAKPDVNFCCFSLMPAYPVTREPYVTTYSCFNKLYYTAGKSRCKVLFSILLLLFIICNRFHSHSGR
ncbi:hypothetical protein, partial [Mitsuokella sp.]|uniref:hypothetical protein n=1 Tax=Mitsuokella sp. TaxID=2049034 RepID=UPI003D7DB5AB